MLLEPHLGLGFHVGHFTEQGLAAQFAQFVDAVVVVDAHARGAHPFGHVEAHQLHGHALGQIVQGRAELAGFSPGGTGEGNFRRRHEGSSGHLSCV